MEIDGNSFYGTAQTRTRVGGGDRKSLPPEQVLTEDRHDETVESAMIQYHVSRSPKDLELLKALCDAPKAKDLKDDDRKKLMLRARCCYEDCDHDEDDDQIKFTRRPIWVEIAEKLDWHLVVDLSPKYLTTLIDQTQRELSEATAAAKTAGKPLLFVFGEGHNSAVSYASERALLEVACNFGIKQFLCEVDENLLKLIHQTHLEHQKWETCHWMTCSWILPIVIKLGMPLFSIDNHLQDDPSTSVRDQGMASVIQGEKNAPHVKGQSFSPNGTVKTIPSIAVVGADHIAGLKDLIKTGRFYPYFVTRYTTDSLPFELIFPEHMRAAYDALTPKKSGSIGSPR